ncbi:unnamed protein product [Gordionus sp. m RMFG-2023]
MDICKTLLNDLSMLTSSPPPRDGALKSIATSKRNSNILSTIDSIPISKKDTEEVIMVQDHVFSINIQYTNSEYIELQVTPNEMVQEIHQVLMDREETFHRTCFSLQFQGTTLDQFSELKTFQNLIDNSLLKIVEESYTLREVRIHVRHIKDILNSLDLSDAFNGIEGASLSYVNTFIGQDNLIEAIEKQNISKLLQTANIADASNAELPPEHIQPKYSKDISLIPLHPVSSKEKAILCLKSLAFNHWNPPPGPRKMKGDLAYITVITLEDKEFHITACVRGFYVNQSVNGTFNPSPHSDSQNFHSLFDLLNKISPLFKRNLSVLIKKRNAQNSLEKVPVPFQKYSWILPFLEHREDAIRAEDIFESRLGFEDHERVSCREKDLAERVARDRAVFKVGADLATAAAKGALSISRGNALPINPGESSKMHMYIWNNIFFSLGFDIRDHYKELGGDFAAYVAPANDLRGVEIYSDLDVEKFHTLGTVIVDYKGYRITGQTIIPGILEREQEELVVYGSIDSSPSPVTNNSNLPNGKNEDETVSHQKSVDKVIIRTNVEYDKILKEIASKLRVSTHRVYSDSPSKMAVIPKTEINGELSTIDHIDKVDCEIIELHTSYECKGIIGNDRRRYILDLFRTLPSDLNFLPVDGFKLSAESRKLGLPQKYKHQLCVLRPELVEAFVEYVIGLASPPQLSENHEKQKDKHNIPNDNIGEKNELDSDHIITEDMMNMSSLILTDENVITNGSKKVAYKNFANLNDCDGSSNSGISSHSEDKDSAIDSMDINGLEDREDSDEDISPTNILKNDINDINSEKLFYNGVDKSKDSQDSSSEIKLKLRTKFPLSLEDLKFNPDAFLKSVRHVPEDAEKLKAERKLLLDIADFVICYQIPDMLNDFKEHTAVPIDGFSLVEMLHLKGINVRYLGIIAKKLECHSNLTYLKNIALHEMISRSAKHVFKNLIQNVEPSYLSIMIAHFLNCYLGSYADPITNLASIIEPHKNGKKKYKKKKTFNSITNNGNTDWINLTPGYLWKSICKDVELSYIYSIKEGENFDQFSKLKQLKKLVFLRQFCLKCGVQIVLREYALDSPIRMTFHEDDIINMFPIVKHVTHKANDAHTFFLAGQTKIQQGYLKDGFELISESLNLMNSVYGPLHTEITSCLRLLARLCYILGDRFQALAFQHKATIMSERIFGIDHSNTIIDYINLALYYVANFRTGCALKLLYRARYLLLLITDNDHPELIALDSNLGLVLYANGLYELSMSYLENALRLSIDYYGETNLKTAVIHHLIAGVHSCKGDFRTAIIKEKQAFNIYKNSLGENHDKTSESAACLRHLTQQAVAMQKCLNASANKSTHGNANNTNNTYFSNNFLPSLHIQKPSLTAILDLMNIINGILFVQIRPSDLNNFTEAEKQLILTTAHNLSIASSQNENVTDQTLNTIKNNVIAELIYNEK